MVTRIKSCAATAADPQQPRKGVQDGDWEWGTPLWKTGRTDFRWLDNFSRFYELNSCISMHLEKHWNPSWWWLFLLTSKSFTTLAETFWKNMCLIACTPPSPKSDAHWPSVPASLEQFLTAIWDAVSQAIVLILPQIKVNSQVSHCAFFFSQQLWIPSNLSVDLVDSYSLGQASLEWWRTHIPECCLPFPLLIFSSKY